MHSAKVNSREFFFKISDLTFFTEEYTGYENKTKKKEKKKKRKQNLTQQEGEEHPEPRQRRKKKVLKRKEVATKDIRNFFTPVSSVSSSKRNNANKAIIKID